jgi:type IV pilus assembly protein PilB
MAYTRATNGSPRLGDILLERGYVTEDEVVAALSYQQQTGAKLGDALVRQGTISEEQLAEVLAAQKKLPVLALQDVYPNPRAVALLTEKFIRARQVLPIDFERDALILAMVNPLDVVTVDDVRVISGHEVVPVVATGGSFREAVHYIFSTKGNLDASDPEGAEQSSSKVAEEREHAEDHSIVNLVDEILDTAIKRRASDIHFEPQADRMPVRVRIDGVLHSLTEIPSDIKGGVISRIKILGDMDIAEKRLPQDGRATYRSPDSQVDLRIASIPTVFGENVTIRVLDESSFNMTLEGVGLDEAQLAALRNAISVPHGQVLITGPTGSGKSTTLYAALEELNRPGVKIYTVEDPVERKMAGILQSQVKPMIGLSFAKLLRSLVRSDPDIIMVGEIRDLETAMISTEASLTGHLVLSTLHTNDAPSAVSRLIEMGVPPYLISSALECVVAQRLARCLCERCREEVRLTPKKMTVLEREILGPKETTVWRPTGCPRCFGTGYSGRAGLFEVLPVTKHVRQMILDGKSTDSIREHALKNGMVPLREDGRRKVLLGLTTVEEVARVTA